MPQSICNLARTCSKLHLAATDDQRVWRPLVAVAFGARTTPAAWMLQAPVGGAGASAQQPGTHQQLYRTLSEHAALAGTWRAATNSTGALYHIRWCCDGMEVLQLLPAPCAPHVRQQQLCVLGPAHPRFTAELLDADKLLLRDYGTSSSCSSGGGGHSGSPQQQQQQQQRHAPLHAAAEAAASVAVGGPINRSGSSGSSNGGAAAGDAAAVAGSSPGGAAAFAAELARFMAGAVLQVREEGAHQSCSRKDTQQRPRVPVPPT